MRTIRLAILLAALIAGLLAAAPAHCGSLTVENQTTDRNYCAVFDLWSLSGPDKRQLSCGPNLTTRFETPTMEAIGKIAVYILSPHTSCTHPPQIPEARHDPGGMLLPSRNFLITIPPDGTVHITEHD